MIPSDILVEELLRCTRCSGRLNRSDSCLSCSLHGPVGVVHASGVIDVSCTGQPNPVAGDLNTDFAGGALGALARAASREDLLRKLRPAFLQLARIEEHSFSSYARELSVNRGGVALLAPIRTGTVSLVVGSSWGAIPGAVSTLGGHVIGIDTCLAALSYANLLKQSPREHYVRVKEWLPLPFPDSLFDTVFLTDAWVESTGARRAADGLRLLIKECGRVLKPGGTLVMEAPNRLSFLALIGKRASSQGGKLVALLPDTVVRRSARLRNHVARLPSARTHGVYSRLLESTGFGTADRFIPWPNGRHWSNMRRAAEVERTALKFGGERRRDKLADAFFRLLRTLHIQTWFVPDYVYVARKKGIATATHPASVVETIRTLEGIARTNPPVLRSYTNSASIIFHENDRVFKVPLTRDGQTRLDNERQALTHLADHPIGSLAMRPIAYREKGEAQWAVYPLLVPVFGQERISDSRRFLDLLLKYSTPVRMRSTQAWERIFNPSSIPRLAQLGADRLLEHFQSQLADKETLVGLVHGDFALHNILRSHEGHTAVIDWDRSEQRSPIFLDAIAASHFYAFRHLAGGGWGQDNFTQSWELHFRRDPRLQYHDEIGRCMCDLEWEAMVGFAVLNQIYWDSGRDAYAPAFNDDLYRSWIQMCERYLFKG